MEQQRIEAISDADASPEVRAIFDGSRGMINRVANLIRTVAHSPQQARWLLALMMSVQRDTEGTVLDPRLRELAILATSKANGCRY
jgi:alkylhydroperoxidase family enzyme